MEPINRRQLLLAGTAATLATPAMAADARPDGDPVETLELWPGGAPGAGHVEVHEEVIERSPAGPLRDRFVQHVTRPTLTLFAPRTAWNGVTLLIVPGGGYVRVVIDKEGYESARWFAERGFAAAVLRYRLPADGWAAGADAPVHDAQRALRLLRHRARTAGSPARRIGVIGFSAGGHLSARLITEPALAYARHDSIDEQHTGVDFAVLMYPVIATTGPQAHVGSANQLRKAGVPESGLDGLAPDRNVTSQTPPTLLVHAGDDRTVPVENSLSMYQALRRAQVRAELHVFDSGGHGFGLRGVTGRTVAAWPELAARWAMAHDPPAIVAG
jgi:acetyl esterase/lipase